MALLLISSFLNNASSFQSLAFFNILYRLNMTSGFSSHCTSINFQNLERFRLKFSTSFSLLILSASRERYIEWHKKLPCFPEFYDFFVVGSHCLFPLIFRMAAFTISQSFSLVNTLPN